MAQHVPNSQLKAGLSYAAALKGRNRVTPVCDDYVNHWVSCETETKTSIESDGHVERKNRFERGDRVHGVKGPFEVKGAGGVKGAVEVKDSVKKEEPVEKKEDLVKKEDPVEKKDAVKKNNQVKKEDLVEKKGPVENKDPLGALTKQLLGTRICEPGASRRAGVSYAAVLKGTPTAVCGEHVGRKVIPETTTKEATQPACDSREVIPETKTEKANEPAGVGRKAIPETNTETALQPIEKEFPDTHPDEPKRASFMGLPVELRLQIYALIPLPPTNAIARLIHCCATSDQRLACSCASHNQKHAPAILAVNSQINSEAFEVFYQNLEIRLTSTNLPAHAAPHVRKVVIFAHDMPSCLYNDNIRGCGTLVDPQHRSLGWVWPHLASVYPGLEQVRIHYETLETTPTHLSLADAESIRDVMHLIPNIKKVIVQSHNRTDWYEGIRTSERRLNIARYLRRQAYLTFITRQVVVAEEGCGEEVRLPRPSKWDR